MREAISESGKRLSSMVAENQSRALAALLEDFHGRQLSTKRKVIKKNTIILYLILVLRI
jgi:hypothetical protein